MRTALPLVSLPLSASSSPASILRRVDLPVPFMPMSPILSPSFMPKEILSKSILSVLKLFDKFSAVSRFILSPKSLSTYYASPMICPISQTVHSGPIYSECVNFCPIISHIKLCCKYHKLFEYALSYYYCIYKSSSMYGNI